MSLRTQACRLLQQNDRGGFTVPSPRLYPHQWAWDSAFAAIGWAHFQPDRAVLELETLLDSRWEDGRIPHIRFHQPRADYFPGPDFWGTAPHPRPSSSITQPPVWATAARRVLELGGDAARLKALLPWIHRSHEFFREQRDPLGWHLVAVVHPWESGLDNSPAWDQALADVDPTHAGEFRRVDKERVEDAAQRPTDEQYRRYASLVKQIEADGFGPGPFAVYDPMMTALLVRSMQDLDWLVTEVGAELPSQAEQARRMQEALMTRLWGEKQGRFAFYDARAGRAVWPDILAAHMPAILDLPVRDTLLQRLAQEYATPWPLPTTAPKTSEYDPHCYWRGPVWINTNWLLAPHVPRLQEKTLELVERSGFWEYFHPESGKGLGGADFTWTAALVLDLLALAG